MKLAAWLASLRDTPEEGEAPKEGDTPVVNGSHAPQAPAEETKARAKKTAKPAGLVLHLTPEERTRVTEITDRAGLSVTTYARWKMLGEKPPRTMRRPLADKEELVLVLAQIEKVKRDLVGLSQKAPAAPIERGDFSEVMGDLDTLKDAVLELLARQLRSSSSEGNVR